MQTKQGVRAAFLLLVACSNDSASLLTRGDDGAAIGSRPIRDDGVLDPLTCGLHRDELVRAAVRRVACEDEAGPDSVATIVAAHQVG